MNGMTTTTAANARFRAGASSSPSPAPSRPDTSQVTLLPPAPQYKALKGGLPNTPLAISLISSVLGGIFAASLALTLKPAVDYCDAGRLSWARPQFGLYVMAIGAHHLLEFWTTAGWNPHKLTVDAFLLNNARAYWAAHAFGLAEYLLWSFIAPGKFSGFTGSPTWIASTLAILVAGQMVRSLAMVQAAVSFSHIVKDIQHEDHVLVTHGVYSVSRHPSYFGFFYWAVATQLMLGNVASTIGFVVTLRRFFNARINDEEKHLIRFFGAKYLDYRKRVGTGLPF